MEARRSCMLSRWSVTVSRWARYCVVEVRRSAWASWVRWDLMCESCTIAAGCEDEVGKSSPSSSSLESASSLYALLRCLTALLFFENCVACPPNAYRPSKALSPLATSSSSRLEGGRVRMERTLSEKGCAPAPRCAEEGGAEGPAASNAASLPPLSVGESICL